MAVKLEELIRKGGVFDKIEGASSDLVYKEIVNAMSFSESVSKNEVYEALCAREKIMSTAVGNGIALPHCRIPVIKDMSDQRIAIVYLKEPLPMNAPDGIPVNTMFVILAQNQSDHIQILSALAGLLKVNEFRKLLADHASEAEILNAVKEFAQNK
ncbi:MAG: PTS sugar transporter subunit IIA [Treponema sp.]|nr:PTS sugar transporter subunit IIA [Treponema sp.]